MTAIDKSREQLEFGAKYLEGRPIRNAPAVEHSHDDGEKGDEDEDDCERDRGQGKGKLKDKVREGPASRDGQEKTGERGQGT